jgi:hypothetical protein
VDSTGLHIESIGQGKVLILSKGQFITDYIMTLENTFLDDDDASIAKVHSILISAIMVEYPHFTTDNTLDEIVSNLEVVPLQVTKKGTIITFFNIYTPSLTIDAEAHAKWLALFHTCTYEFYSTANARFPYTCRTCCSQDHPLANAPSTSFKAGTNPPPTGKCPFHQL